MSTGAKQRVLEIAARRFPCGELPRNVMKEIAEEAGCTKEYVRQVLRLELGMPYIAKPQRVCKDCGAPPQPHSSRCLDCAMPPRACDECGVVFRRPRGLVLRSASGYTTNFGTYTGRAYCSRNCVGKWAAKNHGFGSPRRRAAS